MPLRVLQLLQRRASFCGMACVEQVEALGEVGVRMCGVATDDLIEVSHGVCDSS